MSERRGSEPRRPDVPTVHEPKRSAPRTPQVAVGEKLGGRYLLIEVLGKGAYGSVYRARGTQLDREVAFKVRHGFVERMSADGLDAALQEGRSLARLEHPNTVPVFDAGRVDGLPFLSGPRSRPGPSKPAGDQPVR